MHHILAIDEGTTGTRCLMVRSDGVVTGRGYREITQYFPGPGLVEHDAAEILARTLEAAHDAIRESGATADVIGITNQRETVVVWDRESGKPLYRALVWQDRRTSERCRALADKADFIMRTTGLVVDPYFSATKLEWLLSQPAVAAARERGTLAAGTIDSWLIWSLTGGAVHATDYTNASRTMLFDINERRWSSELLELFGVDATILPDVRASGASFGSVLPEFFGATVPIHGVAGDQQAALMGQGCWHPGEGKNTYGTGAFLLLNAGTERPTASNGILTTLACTERGEPCYALEASIFIAGAAIQWLRDGLGILTHAAESEAMARSIESNDGVYFVPALTGLGAPWWEADARGMITGLTRGTSRAHFARAALEAMAYGTADVLAAMQSSAKIDFSVLRVDGGASANGFLMQFQADLLGVTVERPADTETTSLGAAALAGIQSGIWRDGGDFLGSRQFTRFEPNDNRGKMREWQQGWHRAVAAVLRYARDVGIDSSI